MIKTVWVGTIAFQGTDEQIREDIHNFFWRNKE